PGRFRWNARLRWRPAPPVHSGGSPSGTHPGAIHTPPLRSSAPAVPTPSNPPSGSDALRPTGGFPPEENACLLRPSVSILTSSPETTSPYRPGRAQPPRPRGPATITAAGDSSLEEEPEPTPRLPHTRVVNPRIPPAQKVESCAPIASA